jgi:hypothetical protein
METGGCHTIRMQMLQQSQSRGRVDHAHLASFNADPAEDLAGIIQHLANRFLHQNYPLWQAGGNLP